MLDCKQIKISRKWSHSTPAVCDVGLGGQLSYSKLTANRRACRRVAVDRVLSANLADTPNLLDRYSDNACFTKPAFETE